MFENPRKSYKFIDPSPPEIGDFLALDEAVSWLRMPLPMALDHINLWLLKDGDGWTIVDTGLHFPPAMDAWQRLLEKLQKTGPVKKIIVTHYHPDHAGNAGWLIEQTGAEFYMSETEWLAANLLKQLDKDVIGKKMSDLGHKSGLDQTRIDQLGALGGHYQKAVGPLPTRYHRLFDGDELTIDGRKWRVIMAHGHALEHACLYCVERKILIAGDHVLPEITPNISTHWYIGWNNPLKGFLNSNQKLYEILPNDLLVLPSHRQPFHGLHQRLYELQTHHQDRLNDTRKALKESKTGQVQAADVLSYMFHRPMDGFSLMFAIGEAEAHLRYLHMAGEVELMGDNKDLNRPWIYKRK